MSQLVTFSELSNNVDTTETGSTCVLWLAELQSLWLFSILLERNMDINLLHRKSFGSGTTN
jgi:hypothetical protein